MRIATCDDEREYCDQVEFFVTRLGEELQMKLQCDKYTSGADLLKNNFQKYKIIFLDIDMKSENGLEIAEKIRESNSKIEIIFLTALIQYAVDGYKVRAYRFLVKPMEYDDFVFQVKGLFLRLGQLEKNNLLVKREGQDYMVKIEDLLYIEVLNHDLTYHCTKNDITAPGIMRKVEIHLKEHCFVRIHNSFIVNMKFIARVQSQLLTLTDGTELPLARSKKDTFRRAYLDFWGDELG